MCGTVHLLRNTYYLKENRNHILFFICFISKDRKSSNWFLATMVNETWYVETKSAQQLFFSTTRINNEPDMLLWHRINEKNKNKIREKYTVSDSNNVSALLA